MSNSPAKPEQIKIKRGLRLRIGRLRRHINSRIRGSQDEGWRLLSWRTYVKRYPGGSLAAAFGVGMTMSAGLRGPRLIHAISAMLVRRGAGVISEGFRGELQKIWEDSTPTKNRDSENTEPKAAGVDDGR